MIWEKGTRLTGLRYFDWCIQFKDLTVVSKPDQNIESGELYIIDQNIDCGVPNLQD